MIQTLSISNMIVSEPWWTIIVIFISTIVCVFSRGIIEKKNGIVSIKLKREVNNKLKAIAEWNGISTDKAAEFIITKYINDTELKKKEPPAD